MMMLVSLYDYYHHHLLLARATLIWQSETSIFDKLREVEARSAGKVVHLTPALDQLRVDFGLQGFLLQAR